MSTACTFALFFGNRGFFPSSCMAAARSELVAALAQAGHTALCPPEDGMRHGAVETAAEGRAWARWFAANRERCDGVILCLPNFGDENGAVAAMQDAGMPILVHAYPDDLDKMAPATRRDAFCGKMSVMDVFRQVGIRFTALAPHVVHPASAAFQANLAHFAAVCRVVRGLRRFSVGAIDARTTAFKTVRVDEVALQSVGVTVEATDLSDVMARMRALQDGDDAVLAKAERLRGYTDFSKVPGHAFVQLAKLGVVLDQVAEELGCDALALRCWIELQKELNISPCVLLSELNDRGMPAACEVDVGNAVVMRALKVDGARTRQPSGPGRRAGAPQRQGCRHRRRAPAGRGLLGTASRTADQAALSHCTTAARQQIVFTRMRAIADGYLRMWYR